MEKNVKRQLPLGKSLKRNICFSELFKYFFFSILAKKLKLEDAKGQEVKLECLLKRINWD